MSSPHYNTAYGWFAGPGLSYSLGLTKSVTRLLLSTTVVKLEGGTWGYISLIQLYIFISVQILAYFCTEYLYKKFSPPKGDWRAQATPPPKYAPGIHCLLFLNNSDVIRILADFFAAATEFQKFGGILISADFQRRRKFRRIRIFGVG